jgi:hypothetical protein
MCVGGGLSKNKLLQLHSTTSLDFLWANLEPTWMAISKILRTSNRTTSFLAQKQFTPHIDDLVPLHSSHHSHTISLITHTCPHPHQYFELQILCPWVIFVKYLPTLFNYLHWDINLLRTPTIEHGSLFFNRFNLYTTNSLCWKCFKLEEEVPLQGKGTEV